MTVRRAVLALAAAAVLAWAGVRLLRGITGLAAVPLGGVGFQVFVAAVLAAAAMAAGPPPARPGPVLVDRGGGTAPRWALAVTHDRLRRAAPVLIALAALLLPLGLLVDGLLSGRSAPLAEGAAGIVVLGGVAAALAVRRLPRSAVHVTEIGVEVRRGGRSVDVVWSDLVGVRLVPTATGTTRSVGLAVRDPVGLLHRGSTLARRLVAEGEKQGVHVAIAAGGLSAAPELVHALIEHYHRNPQDRAGLADHDWAAHRVGPRD